MIGFLISFTILAAWGALALGIVLTAFTLIDWTHELVTGRSWLPRAER